MDSQHKTVPQIAQETGEQIWKVRRVVDAMGVAVRIGLYRLIPAEAVKDVKAELARRAGIMRVKAAAKRHRTRDQVHG
jgi:hypothetical protein